MVTIYHKSLKDKGLLKLKDFKVGSWIHAQDPTSEEIAQLAKKYGLEQGHLTDATDPFEVPRLEIEKNAIYIFTRAPYQRDDRMTTTPVLIALTSEFVLTVTREDLLSFSKFTKEDVQFFTTQRVKFFLQIFQQINITYSNFITAISRQVRSASADVQEVRSSTIAQFVRVEETMNDFLAALNPTSAILKNLLSGKIIEFHEQDHDLVEDLSLSTEQLIELARGSLRTIVNIREGYSTIMTNNLNRVIRLLTVLTIILNVQMIITGLFGMNVALPFSHSPGAFWAILAFMALLSALLMLLFNSKRWL